MVNLNVRIDESDHEKVLMACQGRGCDKSTLVREALKVYLDSAPQASGSTTPTPAVGLGGSNPCDIIDEASGTIKRYRASGELLNQFVPIQKRGGVQYYRDVLGDSAKWLFYKDKSNEWVALSIGRVRK